MARPHYTDAWISESPAAAAVDGEERASLLIAKLLADSSDREAVLRAVLDVCAESGRVIPPDSRLRAFCERLQQQLTTRK